MEYCQGSLSNLMKKERIIFTESLIRTILKDICSGLKFLHEHKIVHLDIKPGKKAENLITLKTISFTHLLKSTNWQI